MQERYPDVSKLLKIIQCFRSCETDVNTINVFIIFLVSNMKKQLPKRVNGVLCHETKAGGKNFDFGRNLKIWGYFGRCRSLSLC